MRRTKEDAERTRQRIIAAALRMFGRYGLARTTLEKVACAAGVTRGAVYWHFNGKRDLLRAVRDAVSVPFLDRVDLTLLRTAGDDPLQRVERYLDDLVSQVEHDRALRQTFEVMSFKCEYVADLAGEREALCRNTTRVRRGLEQAYHDAAEEGLLRADLDPRVAAFETVTFATGLCRLFLLDSARFGADLAREAIAAHMRGRRASRVDWPRQRYVEARRAAATHSRPSMT